MFMYFSNRGEGMAIKNPCRPLVGIGGWGEKDGKECSGRRKKKVWASCYQASDGEGRWSIDATSRASGLGESILEVSPGCSLYRRCHIPLFFIVLCI